MYWSVLPVVEAMAVPLFGQSKHQQAADDDNYLRYQAHLFCIVYRLILSSGTDTLSYYIHQTDADTDGCNTIQIFQNICEVG